MSNDNYHSYGLDAYIRPEIIHYLVNLFPQLSMLDLEWHKNSTSYRVNFFAHLNQIKRSTFDLDEDFAPPYAIWTSLDDNDKLIKLMLNHAIDRVFNELDSTCLYVLPNAYIPPEQIDSCEKIIKPNNIIDTRKSISNE